MQPPRIAEALLQRLLPWQERNAIVGDMAERYGREARRRGVRRARLWYWRQAIAIPARLRLRERRPRMEFHDLRLALRALRKSPGFTCVAILTLALGIGANTAIFSIVYSVALRPLPFPEPERLVQVWEQNDAVDRMSVAWANFVDWRAQSASFEAVSAYNGSAGTVLGGDEPMRLGVSAVSEGFFEVMGVGPVLGRSFAASEHAEGGDPVVLISHALWRQLGSEPDLSVLHLVVAGFAVRVVGVLPEGFAFPRGADIWHPLELTPQSTSRTAHNYRVIGRLANGVEPSMAREELSLITARLVEGQPDDDYLAKRAVVIPLRAQIAGPVLSPLLLLLAASLVVVLVACTNLASTMLARGSARANEVAVQRALGASRYRIVRRLFAESLLLAVLGAGVGLALAQLLIRALPTLLPTDLPRIGELGLHLPVMLATIAVSIAAACLFGLVPALRTSKGEIDRALRGATRGSSAARRRGPWRLLVIGEVAMALVLLTGAALLMRSFWSVLRVDPGFDGEGVVVARVSLPPGKYGEIAQRAVYYDELLEAARQVPGVDAVGMATAEPLAGFSSDGRISVDGGPQQSVDAAYQVADSGYFEALHIPLLRGRLFEDSDTADSMHVVVVNQSLADLAWPGDDPVGKRMTGGGMDNYWDQPDAWATVIGVVADTRQRDLDREAEPAFFFPYRQRAYRAWSASIIARAAGAEPASIVGPLREVIRNLDADVPVEFATVQQVVTRSLGDRRFTMGVLGTFAGLGLLLAALGIYGVVGYTVALRTREMGIRLALGSAPRNVTRMVVRESMTTVGIGLVIGLGAALALSRLLGSMLYEISPTDPWAIGATALTLLGVALLASFVPARRAATIDPLITMRAD